MTFEENRLADRTARTNPRIFVFVNFMSLKAKSPLQDWSGLCKINRYQTSYEVHLQHMRCPLQIFLRSQLMLMRIVVFVDGFIFQIGF